LYGVKLIENIIGIIKSRRMRWTGHVARMEGKMTAYRLLIATGEKEAPRKIRTLVGG
jgi:hypothetical protein